MKHDVIDALHYSPLVTIALSRTRSILARFRDEYGLVIGRLLLNSLKERTS